MTMFKFVVTVDSRNIIPPIIGKATTSPYSLAAWRLYHDLAKHMGPEAEPFKHIVSIVDEDGVEIHDP